MKKVASRKKQLYPDIAHHLINIQKKEKRNKLKENNEKKEDKIKEKNNKNNGEPKDENKK